MKTGAEPTRSGWPADCPEPPRLAADVGSRFRREPMVDWLGPRQLASTGVKAVLSAIFGSYADKREVQAALHPFGNGGEPYDAYHTAVDADGGFWFDFCADLGDGFNSTYAVAWLLSRPELPVPGVERPLPRGRLLILGGDQVYPTATKSEYNNRFVGPYQAAFPWQQSDNPHLYAIPGNHDWYDGLTSFLRLFCQRRWIGGWRTRQRRSYFALRLPHGWWLWGTDIQLESDIDRPQLEFFQEVGRRIKEEAAGEAPRLILCTAQPPWVYCDEESPKSRRPPRRGCRLPVAPGRVSSLEYFYREAVAPSGARLAAIVSGDLHHYTAYQEVDAPDSRGPQLLVTSGGGGAYLYPTHHMPERLDVPWMTTTTSVAGAGTPVRSRRFRLQAMFPSGAASRRLARLSWLRLPWRNRGFALLLAGIYLLYAWIIQSASKSGNFLFQDWWSEFAAAAGRPPDVPRSLMELLARLDGRDFPQVFHAFWDVLRHSPSGVVFGLAVVFGLWRYRLSGGPPRLGGASGAVHGLLHLVLSFVLVWICSWLNLTILPLSVDSLAQVLLFSAEMAVGGCLLGGWLFGLYLLLSSRLTGAHTNDVFASQGLDSFKNFLRLRIDKDGRLTIHPIGIPQVPRDWTYRGGDPGLRPGDAWFEPPGGAIGVELIGGKPIELS